MASDFTLETFSNQHSQREAGIDNRKNMNNLLNIMPTLISDSLLFLYFYYYILRKIFFNFSYNLYNITLSGASNCIFLMSKLHWNLKKEITIK